MEKITRLTANEVFVFGSNRAGEHGKGAAKFALKFGAKEGQGEGLQGRAYAIPTKGRNMERLNVREIGLAVDRFLKFARQNPNLRFLVTKIGCGLARHKVSDMARLFIDSPTNVVLPAEFVEEIAKLKK